MIGFDVRVNGNPLCLASVGDVGALSAILTWVGRVQSKTGTVEGDVLTLHVGGLSGKTRFTWPTPPTLSVGDAIEIRIVNLDSAEEATKTATLESASSEGKNGWFDEVRAKYGKLPRR